MAETHEERTDRLAGVVLELVDRLRTEPAIPLLHDLLDPLDRLDVYGICGLLGAAVDPTVPPSIWWGWVRHGVTAMTADPIRWDTELDALDALADAAQEPHVNQRKTAPDPIDARIAELAEARMTDREIGGVLGLSRDAVAARRKRARIPSGAGKRLAAPVAEAA